MAGAVLLCWLAGAHGACEVGRAPGSVVETEGGGREWRPFDEQCQVERLLPRYLGGAAGAARDGRGAEPGRAKNVSMLLLGDSVERATVWDLNDTALAAGAPGHRSLLNEHWRVAFALPQLEVVYQFTPGSHIIGPFHDDVSWNKTVANALPRGLELHRLLTGRDFPNIVVFSNILWDVGRWQFLAEIAEPERMEHYGKPLLREQEFLPWPLLEEWRADTEWQMHRIERMVPHDTLLIYHNAAFALLANCSNGTQHVQKGTGRRTHLAQLNALSRQLVAERPRWHLVDLGAMSEAFLDGSHLRDEHHPNRAFLLQVFDMYLTLHQAYGKDPRPAVSTPGSVAQWDAEYLASAERVQARHLAEAERDLRELEEQKARAAKARESHLRRGYSWLMNVRVG